MKSDARIKLSRRDVLVGMGLAPALLRANPQPARSIDSFRRFAPTPPMGWNSWDSFGPTIREDDARTNAQIMAQQLLPHGYDIFTIDIQWYEPGANSYDYRKGAELTMDQWGRLTPAPNRFPSAAGGAGFAPLARYIHGLGLKFGIHILRGVPRQAAERNTPVLGTHYGAADIADRVHVCEWNADMFGIDMSHPGAQEYYDSIVRLYASWGVDFIKADDMSRPYQRNAPEIHALRGAIDRCGRPIALSLSPGETPLAAGADVIESANMWRISDDFWDSWPALLEQFERLRKWTPYRREGNWPDADMLPLGVLDLGRRKTRFTADEQVTLMTLWSIARSPLIMGGDLRKLDAATRELLTNDEVLAVNRASRENREIRNKDGFVLWQAREAQGPDSYVAVFNMRDPEPAAPAPSVTVALAELGLSGPHRVRDLWKRADLALAQDHLAATVAGHGAALFRLSPS
jgi:alpha-galactosidase